MRRKKQEARSKRIVQSCCIFHLSSFICHLSSLIFHLSSPLEVLGSLKKAGIVLQISVILITFATVKHFYLLKLNAYERTKIKKMCKINENVWQYQPFYLFLPMSSRRERAKAQNRQSNQQMRVETIPQQMESVWKENLGKYLIDISKYVVTGVMITSLFKDLDDKIIIYICSFIISISALIVGLVLTNKKKKGN